MVQSKIDLSEKEKRILGLAWKCFETPPKLDYNKLAALGGYTNPKSAINILTAAKKKLMSIDDISGGDADQDVKGSPSKKRATPAKARKRKAEDSDEEDVDIKPVVKKSKATKASGKKAAGRKIKEEEDDEEGEQEVDGEV